MHKQYAGNTKKTHNLAFKLLARDVLMVGKLLHHLRVSCQAELSVAIKLLLQQKTTVKQLCINKTAAQVVMSV